MAAGDYSKSAIGSKLEVDLTIGGDTTSKWYEVEGLSNLDFNSPNVQKTTFDLLNGRSVQRSGSAQPSTLTAQMSSNIPSEVYQKLLTAKVEGTTLPFRFSTAPAELVFDGKTGGKVAVANNGVLTFSGTPIPDFGGDKSGLFAVGHALQIADDAAGSDADTEPDLLRIVSIGADTSNAWKGIVTVMPPAAAISTPIVYKIVNPLAQTLFNGTITQIGNLSAAPSSAVNTDTLEVSATTVVSTWTFHPYTA